MALKQLAGLLLLALAISADAQNSSNICTDIRAQGMLRAGLQGHFMSAGVMSLFSEQLASATSHTFSCSINTIFNALSLHYSCSYCWHARQPSGYQGWQNPGLQDWQVRVDQGHQLVRVQQQGYHGRRPVGWWRPGSH